MIKKRLAEYIRDNLQLKTIRFEKLEDKSYRVSMTSGEERLTRTAEVVAQEILDIFMESLKN